MARINEAEGTVIEGFFFDGDDNQSPGAIAVERSTNCIVRDIRIQDFNFCGLFLHESDSLNIHDCRHNPQVSGHGGSRRYC